tara:strand:- start:344 stop:913 length:570 start_codon:yes stop_codon:yes gene_type:complete
MHTEPKDPSGQDLIAIAENLNLGGEQLRFSTSKMPPQELAKFYNIADCTINISDAEGFGLATLESLACATPIIVNMTGGLQEQVTDGQNVFGQAIYPSSKAIIGSQDVPYICEDRISKQDFLNAMLSIYNMTSEERQNLGKLGQQHVFTNYSMETFKQQWQDTVEETIREFGSWENRKKYNRWELLEIK